MLKTGMTPHSSLSTSGREGRRTVRMPESEIIETIPLLEETVRIEKRQVEKERLIVRKTVHHRDETIETLLRSQELSVQRVPVNRMVAEMPPIREEGDVLVVPVCEEVLVTERRLILKEEVRIRRTETHQPVQQTVRLRREEVVVERPPLATPSKKES